MKLLRLILIAVVVIVAALSWIGPAGVLYFAKTAPAVVRVVPTNLQDQSTSQAAGTKLSYFGCEFEVPWNDLDQSQTRVFPENEHHMHMVWVSFHSGLKLFVAITPRNEVVPDYSVLKRIYESTPDNVHYWSLIEGWGYRDAHLLLAKWAFLQSIGDPGGGSNPAETGIFNLQSQGYNGFQYGDPRTRPDVLQLRLYSDDVRVDVKFLQGGYYEAAGVTQPEINRIVQSLHRTTVNETPIAVTSN
ncbi:MAG TPA: hypothetical protein VKR60_07775 [Candidatus Sulfotelmatobacter sp.]|nr:hypothetical protein [Candidatus Sulfotelmatobacter sp.]